jgi:hypothetical protein
MWIFCLRAVIERGRRTWYVTGTYLFAFAAGKFATAVRTVDGRRMTMFHRESDLAKVSRNIDAIFQLHGSALDWMELYTGIPYPYEKFDFVILPAFPFSGMEHPGSIFYSAMEWPGSWRTACQMTARDCWSRPRRRSGRRGMRRVGSTSCSVSHCPD